MMTPEDVISFLKSLAGCSQDYGKDYLCNGREAMLVLRSTGRVIRQAAVRTPGSRWFSVEIEDTYDLSFVDEDAQDWEVREYLAKCLRIAEAYIRTGALEARRGILRYPTIVVTVDGSTVELGKLMGRRRKRVPD